ncbi:zinc finger protein 14-like [Wyeomyia smithii]|uniref:zinc finger protein 14-like n=1 Tax=Wyeomyia smithii TaxID=174621 RepID=UPI0024681585|nr:zinc finger protein 14-like [Wyeomyia smithii]
MTSKIYTLACRICTQADVDEMDSLYDTVAEEKTPAQIIEECFGIAIKPDDGLPTKYCQSCKEDLGAALRFRCRLQESDAKFNDLLAVPKIEITEPADGNISSVFISEIFIKAEDEDQSDCEEMLLNDDNSVEIIKPRVRQKRLQNKRKKKLEDNTSEQHEDLSDCVEGSSAEEEEIQPDASKPAKKRWAEIKFSDCSSSDDNFSDYDSGQSSDSETEEKPKKKRLYYGVKADSLPKRCCSCKDLPLDSHEKVQEHSDKYHYRYRITNTREIEENPFECLNCYKRFDSKKEFLRHQRKMYVERLHPCPKCDEEFANHYVLQRHLKLYHKKKMIIERMEELRQESHICCACKKKFDTREQLKAHADEIHLKERQTYEGDFEFECEVCYRRFKTRQSMKVHQYRMFKGKKFICALCGKAFKEKAFLRDHENSHRREKPYECPKCDARFSIKGSYDAHVRLHDAKEEFKCEYCGRGFRTKSLLKGHLTVHSEDRPFKCHLCPITFTQQRLLDSHIEFHLGNKPFKCQQCPASYRYQRDLRGHIREKHEGILSFQCTYCPKAFNRKKPLMVHLKTHEVIIYCIFIHITNFGEIILWFTMNENLHCQICGQPQTLTEMSSLSEPLFDGCSAAQIIWDCFRLKLSDDNKNSLYCKQCKQDMVAASIFVNKIRQSNLKLESITTILEEIPKVEIVEPTDTTIVSVFITETDIKTECTEDGPGLLSNVTSDKSVLRSITKNEGQHVAGSTMHNDESDKTKKILCNGIKQEELRKKNGYVKVSRRMSSHSARSDDGISASSSDSEESDYEAEENCHDDSDEQLERKRRNYGVKPNSQPKRCCSCKNMTLDTPEKVEEHSVKYHLKMRLSNPKDFEGKVFECLTCFMRFETKKLYLQHQRKMYVDMLHPCKQCEEEFANFHVLQKHMKNNHQRKLKIHELEEMRIQSNICCGCRVKFTSQEELKAHAHKVHLPNREQNYSDNTVECDVCYKIYKSAKYLKDHRLRFFKKKNLICSQCGRSFRERSQLEGHEDSHRNVRKYECPICSAKFSMKTSWQVHVKYHDAKENFHCEYCGKGFRKKGLMKAHLRIHSTDRPHKCPMCPLTFTQKNRLNSHVLEHSGLKSFKCDRCPASYVHQRALRRHVRDKHEGIQTFKCNICPKGFIEQKPLLIHLKTHERSTEATFSKT